MEERQKLISAKEAAERLGISRALLSRLVKAELLATYRIGHRTLFDEAIIEEYKRSVFKPFRRPEALKNPE
jgi:excisionase family DNA binding protein